MKFLRVSKWENKQGLSKSFRDHTITAAKGLEMHFCSKFREVSQNAKCLENTSLKHKISRIIFC